VVEVLRLAAGDGRLTLEELDERVGAALTARTYGELTALVSDLSAARDAPAGPTRPGIMVDTDDLDLRASTVKVLAPWDPDVPVRFRIDVAGTLDVSSITARPPRRTLGQQLLRRRPLLQALPPPVPDPRRGSGSRGQRRVASPSSTATNPRSTI